MQRAIAFIFVAAIATASSMASSSSSNAIVFSAGRFAPAPMIDFPGQSHGVIFGVPSADSLAARGDAKFGFDVRNPALMREVTPEDPCCPRGSDARADARTDARTDELIPSEIQGIP